MYKALDGLEETSSAPVDEGVLTDEEGSPFQFTFSPTGTCANPMSFNVSLHVHSAAHYRKLLDSEAMSSLTVAIIVSMEPSKGSSHLYKVRCSADGVSPWQVRTHDIHTLRC